MWVLSSLLSCCSFLCSGIKPQCIFVVQFRKIWFRADFLILKSFLFYYFHVVVKNMVTSSERFSGSICLPCPCLSLLFPSSPLPLSCSVLIAILAVPPERGACLKRNSSRSILKVLLCLFQTLAKLHEFSSSF